MAKFKTV